MPSLLSTLPVEIIEAIASVLDGPSLCSVRVTCKELRQKTSYCFGRTCFTALRTDLSSNSLQKLQSISQIESLKHHVQTLLIKNEVSTNLLGKGFQWYRVGEGNKSYPLDTSLSPGVKMLQDILAKLVNCRSFQIYSYGETDNEPAELLPTDIISLILGIIAETGLPIKSFHIYARTAGVMPTKRLQMHSYQHPKFISAWKNLEELHLELALTSGIFNWTRSLVLQTMSLRKLTLDFYFGDYSFTDSLLSSLDLLKGLQEVKLTTLHVTMDVLSSFLLRYRSSLRTLTFYFVQVRSGTWAQILTELRTFPFLESLTVDFLRQYKIEKSIFLIFHGLENCPEVPGSGGQTFKLRRKWGKGRVFGASFHGRMGMEKALEMLADCVVEEIPSQ